MSSNSCVAQVRPLMGAAKDASTSMCSSVLSIPYLKIVMLVHVQVAYARPTRKGDLLSCYRREAGEHAVRQRPREDVSLFISAQWPAGRRVAALNFYLIRPTEGTDRPLVQKLALHGCKTWSPRFTRGPLPVAAYCTTPACRKYPALAIEADVLSLMAAPWQMASDAGFR